MSTLRVWAPRSSRVSSSSQGSPIRPRKTAEGNGTANSSVKWHAPRSMKPSIKRLTRAVTSSSIASIRRGANSGSQYPNRNVACWWSAAKRLSSDVLPMPASPLTTTTRPSPLPRTAASASSSELSSRVRSSSSIGQS